MVQTKQEVKQQEITDYRNRVGDRIDRRFGAFTAKSSLLQDENLRRMCKELRAAQQPSARPRDKP